MSDDTLVVEFDVRAPVERAFAVWTERAGVWWPKGHTVSGDPDSVRFEPRVGGRIVERARDGAEHVWGEVTAWDAPSRIEFLWHLFFDRTQATRVALTFSDQGATTRVRLEQSGFAALGEAGAVRRDRTLLSWGTVTSAYVGDAELDVERSDAPQRFATIDVGTNSVKCFVAEQQRDGTWTTLSDRAAITRLGQGLSESGVISSEALDRTADAIGSMVDEARGLGAREVVAVGTAGLRIARNGSEVVAAIASRTGVHVEVVSGEEESRLAYLAACAGLGVPTGSALVFDTGGGSSQFTFGHGAVVDERFSVDVGAAGITERFGLAHAVARDVVDRASAAIATGLARLEDRPVPRLVVGMGGAVVNLAAVQLGLASYDPARLHGAVLDRAEVQRQIEVYRGLDADDRRALLRLQPERAEVILAGACIVDAVLRLVGSDRLVLSDRSLRHGLMEERFGVERSP